MAQFIYIIIESLQSVFSFPFLRDNYYPFDLPFILLFGSFVIGITIAFLGFRIRLFVFYGIGFAIMAFLVSAMAYLTMGKAAFVLGIICGLLFGAFLMFNERIAMFIISGFIAALICMFIHPILSIFGFIIGGVVGMVNASYSIKVTSSVIGGYLAGFAIARILASSDHPISRMVIEIVVLLLFSFSGMVVQFFFLKRKILKEAPPKTTPLSKTPFIKRV